MGSRRENRLGLAADNWLWVKAQMRREFLAASVGNPAPG
jgi:hypothetical protein